MSWRLDPLTFAIVGVTLLIVAVAACAIPEDILEDAGSVVCA